ncbi:MAG: DNA polymerase III subunit delta [Oscillospiraceae bacterium]|nr:DNA polymerase III subunit delta [Oscillospiraceae bacterium]
MPVKNKDSDGYKSLTEALKNNQLDRFYIFHGEERYLLENMLGRIRAQICPDGLSSFNYRRFVGKGLTIDELDEAIDTLPSFAQRTLIEVHDFDIFSASDKPRLTAMLSNLPEYVCLVFIYEATQYKPDRRVKANTEILKHAVIVDFAVQDTTKLVRWINAHYRDAGKNISEADAKYLAFITGGYMSALCTEIEKTAAYAKGDAVTRADIDAVVVPVLDAVAYKLTDALARREHASALKIMDELFQMKEAPHKLIFSISLKMRQLLAARICLENNLGRSGLIEMCGIRHEFQARALMETAQRASLSGCREAVLCCSSTALELNSSTEPESRLIELVTKLASI